MPRSETSRQKVLVTTMGKCIKGAKFYLPPLSVSPHLVLPLHPVLCLWEAQSSSFKCPTEARPQTSQGLELSLSSASQDLLIAFQVSILKLITG